MSKRSPAPNGGSASKRARTEDAPEGVTEAEAALYDRQIRLWGLAAQNKMRKAHILVHNLQGIATEVTKNIVLSGIGTLSLVDAQTVTGADLSSGFFYREDEVGQLRADAARDRIQALNPLVKIQTFTSDGLLRDTGRLRELKVDVIVSTSGSRTELVELNARARAVGAKFYAAQTQGLDGWWFSDLGEHVYLVEGQDKKKVQYQQTFVPLQEALGTTWSLPPRKLKRLKLMPGFFATLAHWERPDASAEDLWDEVAAQASARGVDALSLQTEEAWKDFLPRFLAALQAGDFAPTSAVLGGLVAQDVLNALGASQPPMANFTYLDGPGGTALVYKLKVADPRKLSA